MDIHVHVHILLFILYKLLYQHAHFGLASYPSISKKRKGVVARLTLDMQFHKENVACTCGAANLIEHGGCFAAVGGMQGHSVDCQQLITALQSRAGRG